MLQNWWGIWWICVFARLGKSSGRQLWLLITSADGWVVTWMPHFCTFCKRQIALRDAQTADTRSWVTPSQSCSKVIGLPHLFDIFVFRYGWPTARKDSWCYALSLFAFSAGLIQSLETASYLCWTHTGAGDSNSEGFSGPISNMQDITAPMHEHEQQGITASYLYSKNSKIVYKHLALFKVMSVISLDILCCAVSCKRCRVCERVRKGKWKWNHAM